MSVRFTLNCVVLIILPRSHALWPVPLSFLFKILAGQAPPPKKNYSGGGGAAPLTPPPPATPLPGHETKMSIFLNNVRNA